MSRQSLQNDEPPGEQAGVNGAHYAAFEFPGWALSSRRSPLRAGAVQVSH